MARSGALRFSAWVATVLLLLACCDGDRFRGMAGCRTRMGAALGRRRRLRAACFRTTTSRLDFRADREFALRSGIGGIILLSAAGLLVGWCAGWIWWRRSGTAIDTWIRGVETARSA